jgi:hypothetical protein
MKQYVIERDVPGAGALTEAQLQDIARRSQEVARSLCPRIQWIRSYVTEDKIYCVYIAEDEDIIREHARIVGAPANRIEAVRLLLDSAGGTTSAAAAAG